MMSKKSYQTWRVGMGLGLLLGLKVFNAVADNTSTISPELREAVQILESTPTGRALLTKAKRESIPIRDGRVSKTDLIATRRVEAGDESIHMKAEVQISVEKEPLFKALDLAHELSHATPNEHPNPFDPKLTAEAYVKEGIEGQGGEAEAVRKECQVGKEVLELQASQVKLLNLKTESFQLVKARCQFAWKHENDDSTWKKSFYQLGKHYEQFVDLFESGNSTDSDVNSDLNGNEKDSIWEKLQRRSPMFAAAISHKPYPLTLLEEYRNVTRILCGRKPASIFQKRCQMGQSLDESTRYQ